MMLVIMSTQASIWDLESRGGLRMSIGWTLSSMSDRNFFQSARRKSKVMFVLESRKLAGTENVIGK